MANIIKLKTASDKRGSLTVIEKEIPFEIKRVFYIYDVKSARGGHRHKKTFQALVCLNGKCIVSNNNGEKEEDFVLDKPDKCLILEPKDWHTMHSFSESSILLVLASEHFDRNDQISEKYK